MAKIVRTDKTTRFAFIDVQVDMPHANPVATSRHHRHRILPDQGPTFDELELCIDTTSTTILHWRLGKPFDSCLQILG
jgi:hypothetical protein